MASRLILLTEIGKVCTRCNRDLPLSSYYRQRKGTLGLRSECKSCWSVRLRKQYLANKDRVNARSDAWRLANPERMKVIWRRSRLRKKFGISLEDYDAMLAKQGGKCAACRSADNGDRRFNVFMVDHDHETGRVRGLLCSRCNLTLGHVGDDIGHLHALIGYLLRTTDGRRAVGASS